MMNKSTFIKLLLVSCPFTIILLSYIITDPFKVLYHYDDYYTEGRSHRHITLDNDYVALENFKNHYPKEKYNSFIIGSSTTRFLMSRFWEPHIKTNKIYHFDAAVESLFGLERKMDYFEKHHIPIKNALIVLDIDALNNTTDSEGHIFVKHPDLSGRNPLDFQWQFFRTYLKWDFITAYWDYRISGKVKAYMTKKFLFDNAVYFNRNKKNEFEYVAFEEQIKKNPSLYYKGDVLKMFTDRPQKSENTISPKRLDSVGIKMLKNTCRILKEKKSDYRILIPPMYDQIYINPKDLAQIQSIFGKNRVYDFSGKNEFNQEMKQYYEPWHFRIDTGKAIFDEIYTQANP